MRPPRASVPPWRIRTALLTDHGEAWLALRRRTQHPFPVVRLHVRSRRLPARLFERGEPRFQLDSNERGEISGNTDALLECRQKTRESHAHGVKTRRKTLAAENALRVRKQVDSGKYPRGFGNHFHAGTHLRSARRIADDPGELPGAKFP